MSFSSSLSSSIVVSSSSVSSASTVEIGISNWNSLSVLFFSNSVFNILTASLSFIGFAPWTYLIAQYLPPAFDITDMSNGLQYSMSFIVNEFT